MSLTLSICPDDRQWFSVGFSSPSADESRASWANTDVVIVRTDNPKRPVSAMVSSSDMGPNQPGLIQINNATLTRVGSSCRADFRRTYSSGLWPITFNTANDPKIFFSAGAVASATSPIAFPSTSPNALPTSAAQGPTAPISIAWDALPHTSPWVGPFAVAVTGTAAIAVYMFLIAGAVGKVKARRA